MTKYILFIAVIIFFTALFSAMFKPADVKDRKVSEVRKESSISPTPITKKAKFLIFTNGLKRDFSSSMYHKLSQVVYIEAQDPTIVYVKNENLTWNDFFRTLPFELTKECLTTGTGEIFCNSGDQRLAFYLNGVKKDNLLDTIINDQDQALISFGTETSDEIERELKEF